MMPLRWVKITSQKFSVNICTLSETHFRVPTGCTLAVLRFTRGLTNRDELATKSEILQVSQRPAALRRSALSTFQNGPKYACSCILQLLSIKYATALKVNSCPIVVTFIGHPLPMSTQNGPSHKTKNNPHALVQLHPCTRERSLHLTVEKTQQHHNHSARVQLIFSATPPTGAFLPIFPGLQIGNNPVRHRHILVAKAYRAEGATGGEDHHPVPFVRGKIQKEIAGGKRA